MWEIEAAAAQGWQAADREWLGGWLLRAAEGFTGRANSALPLGSPGLPVPEAVAAVEAWYGRRALTPSIVIPHRLDGSGTGPLDRYLDERGWTVRHGPAVVMTREIAAAGGAAAGLHPGTGVEILTAPDPGWLDLYHYQGTAAPPVAGRLMMSAPWQAFAAVRGDGATAAIGRISCAAGWAGLTAIEVAPAYRRQGLARAVVGALARHAAAERGARRLYVQVQDDNEAGLTLYERCGFAASHRYHYRMGSRPYAT